MDITKKEKVSLEESKAIVMLGNALLTKAYEEIKEKKTNDLKLDRIIWKKQLRR